MASGVRTIDKLKVVPATAAVSLTSVASAQGLYVSMKGYNNLTIVIQTTNLLAPTASAVTVNQAKWVNGNSAKACAIDYVWKIDDIANSTTMLPVQSTVVSNTFNTTNSANSYHYAQVEIRADRMDLANGFTALQVSMAQAANTVASVTYIMGNVPRFSGGMNSFTNPIAD